MHEQSFNDSRRPSAVSSASNNEMSSVSDFKVPLAAYVPPLRVMLILVSLTLFVYANIFNFTIITSVSQRMVLDEAEMTKLTVEDVLHHYEKVAASYINVAQGKGLTVGMNNDTFLNMMVPLFAYDSNVIAIYTADENGYVLKFSKEIANYITVERRYPTRREYHLYDDDTLLYSHSLSNTKTYDAREKGWYKQAEGQLKDSYYYNGPLVSSTDASSSVLIELTFKYSTPQLNNFFCKVKLDSQMLVNSINNLNASKNIVLVANGEVRIKDGKFIRESGVAGFPGNATDELNVYASKVIPSSSMTITNKLPITDISAEATLSRVIILLISIFGSVLYLMLFVISHVVANSTKQHYQYEMKQATWKRNYEETESYPSSPARNRLFPPESEKGSRRPSVSPDPSPDPTVINGELIEPKSMQAPQTP